MRLTDSQLKYFDEQVLKLSTEKKTEHRRQVKWLVERLKTKLHDETELRVVRTYRAGSMKKGTVLRPRDGFPVDADVVFYLDAGRAEKEGVDELNQRFKDTLVAVYPQKVEGDFTLQPRTIGVKFSKSGLEVDLVPVMDLPDTDGDGWQPSFTGGEPLITNTRKQLEFIYRRHQGDPHYRTLVRLVKAWRNRQRIETEEMRKLGSFMIELLLAHLQDTEGPAASLEDGLERFWDYLLRSELLEPVAFTDYRAAQPYPADPVRIMDPVNAENNVAGRVTDEERLIILERAEAAWDQLYIARASSYKGRTTDAWEAIFGPRFTVGEEVV